MDSQTALFFVGVPTATGAVALEGLNYAGLVPPLSVTERAMIFGAALGGNFLGAQMGTEVLVDDQQESMSSKLTKYLGVATTAGAAYYLTRDPMTTGILTAAYLAGTYVGVKYVLPRVIVSMLST